MTEIKRQARQQALNVLNQYPLKPTSLLQYQSAGRVLLLGNEEDLITCQDLSSPLQIRYLLMQGSHGALARDKLVLRGDSKVEIRGHLGQFVVELKSTQGSELRQLETDIVVDFSARPLLDTPILPPGYIHIKELQRDVASLQARLQELTGEFEKPKYFQYNAAICAHGANGKTVCTQCIDACPADAISSLVESIQVDPYLCQGGGTCATVCPSGAIQYAYPSLQDAGNRLRKMLQTYAYLDGIVVFHAAENYPQALFDQYPEVLPVALEELASAGMDLWLSALVYGASQVVLLSDDSVPARSLTQLGEQLDVAQSILEGLGIDPLRISLRRLGEDIHRLETGWEIAPAEYAMPVAKRDAIFQAIDHLYQNIKKTREMVTLPTAAPFGEASIDGQRCTLCMACIGACPGHALQDGSNRALPEIMFVESHCIQCGTCTQTCPEQAITISPRILFNREKRNALRSLNQDKPYACIACGKPFASTSVISLMSHKLKDHYMFNTPRARDRLKMCDDCRVSDIVQDPQALNRHLDPLN